MKRSFLLPHASDILRKIQGSRSNALNDTLSSTPVIRRQQRLDGDSEDGAWAHWPHAFPNKCPSLHSLLKSLPLCVPVICLEWASTQLASAFDGVQEPAIQASFGLQMPNFFLILVAKTNAWALFIKEEGERVG